MKYMKKITALLLAVMLVMSLAVGAGAEETTSTLTINTTLGHTYKVYQLLKGDVSNLQDGSGTLSNATVGANVKADTTVENVIAALKDTDGNFLSNEELGNAAYALVDTTKDANYTVTGTGAAVETTVENGYYIVVDSWTSSETQNDALSRYMVAVVGDTTMTPKVSKPEIDKKIIDTDTNAAIDESDKTDTAAIGDTIEYEITSAVPNTEGYAYYYYVVHDTMSKGLTLDETSFVVTVGADTLARGTDYYVYVTNNDDDTTTFQLAFEDMKALVDNGTITVGEAISIKYKATVNEGAEIGVDPNTNTAKLEYSNNPGESTRNGKENEPGVPAPGTATGEGPEYTTKTYVTELTIHKVDNNNMPLDGAEFTLTGENLNKVILTTATEFKEAGEGETAEYYKLKDGTYTTTTPVTDEEADGYNADKYEDTTPKYVRVTNLTTTEATADGTTKKVVGEVDAAGLVTFTGLNVGTYTLTETKTPTGYNTMEPITFTITATQTGSNETTGGNISWVSDNDKIVLDTTNGVFDVTIVNMPGTSLPSTGGMGTTMFYVIGGILVLAAVVLLVTKKRMNNAE